MDGSKKGKLLVRSLKLKAKGLIKRDLFLKWPYRMFMRVSLLEAQVNKHWLKKGFSSIWLFVVLGWTLAYIFRRSWTAHKGSLCSHFCTASGLRITSGSVEGKKDREIKIERNVSCRRTGKSKRVNEYPRDNKDNHPLISCFPVLLTSWLMRLNPSGGVVELSLWAVDGGVSEDAVVGRVTSVSVALAISSAIWCLGQKKYFVVN